MPGELVRVFVTLHPHSCAHVERYTHTRERSCNVARAQLYAFVTPHAHTCAHLHRDTRRRARSCNVTRAAL